MKVYLYLLAYAALQFESQSASGDKILFFFAGNSYSHKVSIWPLVTELAERGHKVTFLSPHKKQPYTSPKVEDVSPKSLQDLMANVLRPDRQKFVEENKESKMWQKISHWALKTCEAVLDVPYENDPVLYDIAHTNRYDLIVINAVCAECAFVLAHQKQSKYVISDATTLFPWHPDIYGVPTESSWIPSLIAPYTYPMTFLNRVENYISFLHFAYYKYTTVYPALEQQLAERFPNTKIPSLLEMESNASLMFINAHFTTDFARSLPPMVISIGGLTCWGHSEEIPKDMKAFMDQAEEGVILIAFGSTFDSKQLATVLLNTFFDMMEKFPKIHFLWKWEEAIDEARKPKNLFVSPWLPQKGILEHPKTLAFISHCGINSIQEATFFGVPIIAFPMFGDQFYNAYRIETEKVGVRLPARQELSTSSLVEKVSEVVNNSEYLENMERMSKMFRDRPASPVETAVYWIEYAIRHENLTPLHPKNTHLNWFQRRDLDVIIVIWTCTLGLPLIVAFVVFKLAGKLYKKSQL